MDVIWSRPGAMPVAEVHAALRSESSTAYTTVKTTLERLASKGILVRKKGARAYLYEAAVSREELERRIVSQVLDRLVEQFPEAVASFFVRPGTTLSAEQLALLAEVIEQRRRDSHG